MNTWVVVGILVGLAFLIVVTQMLFDSATFHVLNGGVYEPLR